MNNSMAVGGNQTNQTNTKHERKRLRKLARELLKKDAFDLELEEGAIFGVKSPAM